MNTLSAQMTGFLSAPFKRKKSVLLLLTILTGIVILYPHLDYQPQLAQGDHGRDLYSYKMTLEGGVPYKDFSSNNGPLMPYYYSFFYLLFGVSVNSALIGYNLCILLAGILIYLICSAYLDPLLSYCASLWYWAFRGAEFFYTYNHIGGIVMMLAAVYFFTLSIKSSDTKLLPFSFLSILLLLLIRPTIGLSALTVFFLFLAYKSISSENQNRRINTLKYILIAVGIFAGTFFIYWLMTKDLPRHISTKEMAFWLHFNLQNIPRGLEVFSQIVTVYFFSSIPKLLFTFIFAAALLLTLIKLNDRTFDKDHKKELLTILGLIVTLAILNLGELFATGIWFYAMWNLSLIVLVLFYAFNIGFCHLSRGTKILIVAVLLYLPLFNALRISQFLTMVKQPSNKLWIGNTNIYLNPTERGTIHTLTNASIFLFNNIAENENFLAIPYDPIYYFLSNRDSATRQLAVFNFSQQNELDLLEDIRENNVRHILISNRAYRDSDPRLGVLGRDYGTLLQKHIDDRFEEIAAFGPWEATSGWTANHAVKIYRKK